MRSPSQTSLAHIFHPSGLAIRSSQERQLKRLLAALSPHNSFYQKKFAEAHFEAARAGLNDFLHHCPFTTKPEVAADQRAHPPYGTNLTYPIAAYTRCHQTSGTSGSPLRWLDTPESWQWMVESWKTVHRAAGVTPADRVYFAFSFGPFIGFWLAFEAASELGCLCLPGGGLSSTARVRSMLDHQATVLCCTPTYAIRLAEVAGAEQIDLGKSAVRTIIVAGEPGGSIPATRQRIEELWPGAAVFDHHGMTEVGAVTFECPKQPGRLHVIETAYLAEVIDPKTGQAVEPGQEGELVLTTLGRTGSPLLRYRTGDIVKPGRPPAHRAEANAKPCVCGRHDLALEGGILGRTDDMVVIRGVNVFPSAVEEILRGFPEITEYQVQISTSQALAEMSLRVELRESEVSALKTVERIQNAFLNAFSLRVPVEVVEPDGLPRFELKAKRWMKSKR